MLKQRVNCEEEGRDEIALLLQEGVIYGEGAECYRETLCLHQVGNTIAVCAAITTEGANCACAALSGRPSERQVSIKALQQQLHLRGVHSCP